MKETPQSSDFGRRLALCRRARELSQTRLAKMTGLSRSTIKNLEEGRTQPSRDSLARLTEVLQMLGSEASSAVEPPHPGCWSSHYDPVSMSREIAQRLNGIGGVMEQTAAYLDNQSAADWLDYAGAASYESKYRAVFPLDALADAVLQHWVTTSFDVVGLGVGDGRGETAVVRALSSRAAGLGIRFYMLDISHPLLVVAYNHATTELASTPVFPIHGNFLALRNVVALGVRQDRPRLWTMLGFTFGNLDHEPRFLFDLGAVASPGDLLLLDVSIGWGSPDDEKAVRAADPALNSPVPPLCEKWLLGPIRRHCPNIAKLALEVDFSSICPVPGTYQLTFVASAVLASGFRARHQLFLLRRYRLAELTATLASLGWRAIAQHTYGTARPHRAGVLLLEKQ